MNILKKYLFALIKCICLFAFGFFTSQGRHLIHLIAVSMGYQDLKRQRKLPTVELDQLFLGRMSPIILHPDARNGNVSFEELAVIAELVRRCKAECIFEFGTFDGRTTLNIAANTSAAAKIFTIDLPREMVNNVIHKLEKGEKHFVDKDQSGSQYKGTEFEQKIIQIYGDSVNHDFSEYIGKMDFVFVDASHEYLNVKSDTENAFRLLKDKRGVIVWHDYQQDWPGVIRALNELYASGVPLRHVKNTSLVLFEKNSEQ